jgi:methyltransferase of FxLD system
MGVRVPRAVTADDLREKMIATLRERGLLRGGELERAFAAVPRHAFLPEVPLDRVYSGSVIPTKHDKAGIAISSSSEVAVMICMVEMLELQRGHRVLEIGAGTGYNAAILATLVGDEGVVTTIELDPAFAAEARAHLEAAGFARVHVLARDGWDGDAERAPFDRIIATASVSDISPNWIDQLSGDGRIVVPLATELGPQILVAFRKDGDDLASVATRPGGFMPLRGPNTSAAPSTEIGAYTVEPVRVAEAAEDILRDVLRERPRIEVGPPLRYEHFAMLALSDAGADVVAVRRTEQPGSAIGILDVDARGLALVELASGPLSGPLTHIVSFGSPQATERLRERLAKLVRIDPREIRIRATRHGPPRHYRFALEQPVAA